MANVGIGALCMAIQALEESIRVTHAEIDAMHEDDPELPELQLYSLSQWKAQQALRAAYEEELATVDNYPPYESLTGRRASG